MANKLCELLGIEYPIIQGGMAWVATAELAAAVSNGGGLGIIAAGNAPSEYVKEQIHMARKLTEKPFGVNVMLISPYVEEVVEMLLEEKVAVITTGAGNPSKYIPLFKEIGTKVIPVIPSVAIAQKVQKSGADAVVAEGCEAGGHIGELTTMTLVPMVVDAVEIPVIAAGGIADSRGVKAAFALGADGVQVGTRFICSDECKVHQNYKDMVTKAKDRDAIVTGRFTGHPVRTLKNKGTKMMDKFEKAGDIESFEKIGAGALRLAVVDGDIQNGSVMAGQSAGLVKDIRPCSDIIKSMF
ncbi:MAG: enoyl-[acyl-carrier-protein] reductase FabK, partial [Oscillospiraceae bacterium]